MLTERITEEIIHAALHAAKPKRHASASEFSKEYIEPINVVDDHDNYIGIEYKGLCHSLGLRHEAIFVFFISPDGRILIQRKTGGLDAGQTLLDVPIEGHVGANEDVGACVMRQMKERLTFAVEIGRLKLIASFNRDTPLSSTGPHEINNERRFLFQYFITAAELERVSQEFLKKNEKKAGESVEWCRKEDIVEAIDMGNITDELLTCFIHYLVCKFPSSEMKMG